MSRQLTADPRQKLLQQVSGSGRHRHLRHPLRELSHLRPEGLPLLWRRAKARPAPSNQLPRRSMARPPDTTCRRLPSRPCVRAWRPGISSRTSCARVADMNAQRTMENARSDGASTTRESGPIPASPKRVTQRRPARRERAGVAPWRPCAGRTRGKTAPDRACPEPGRLLVARSTRVEALPPRRVVAVREPRCFRNGGRFCYHLALPRRLTWAGGWFTLVGRRPGEASPRRLALHPVRFKPLGRRQAVRLGTLNPASGGSNPPAPAPVSRAWRGVEAGPEVELRWVAPVATGRFGRAARRQT